MENLQKSLEDNFMSNIINILEHNTSTTENQKTEILTIFKQKYIHEIINIDDCEADLIQIFNNFNYLREPGNIIITERFCRDFHIEWNKWKILKNNYKISEERLGKLKWSVFQ